MNSMRDEREKDPKWNTVHEGNRLCCLVNHMMSCKKCDICVCKNCYKTYYAGAFFAMWGGHWYHNVYDSEDKELIGTL